MNRLFPIVLSAILAGPVLMTTTASAQDAAASATQTKLTGEFRVENAQTAQASIAKAIDGVVDEMFIIKRPFARSRLTDANPVLVALNYRFDGNKMTYVYNTNKTIEGVIGAPFRPWKSPEDKKMYDIKHDLRGDSLVQTIKGSEGTKEETFKLASGNNEIEYTVVVTSPQLPKPLRYSYKFKRVK